MWDEPDRVGPWVCERLGGTWQAGDNAIGLEKNGELIAGVVFDNYLGRSICMHVAASGEWWLTREFLQAAFGYPFNQLGVHKIIGPVDSKNADARKFDEHLGFYLEATIKDANKLGDLLLYTMTRQQCRWVN